jgi:IMP dehydrogenase
MFYTQDSALTYDDVLIVPNYSEVLPTEVELKTRFSKNISMNIPIASSAMDTVTESRTAIVMAQEGGIGIIHKNLSPEEQAFEVEKVKKYESGMILDPFTVGPDQRISDLFELMKKYKISGFPVVDQNEKLVGIITNRDLRFVSDHSKRVKDVMTSENLVTAPEGTSFSKAKEILQEHRVEKLPVINSEGKLCGLITIKDIEKTIAYPNSNKDKFGRLRVGAACGVSEKEINRVEALIRAQVDVIVIDTAHGHSKGVIEMVKTIKKMNAKVDVVAGNVATAKACEDLIAAGVDGIKVGIGPGSICTTRIIAGIGVPQMQAIFDCRKICDNADVPFIADGGIKYSGDIVKALAGGASCVMIGSLFAGTDEAPGEMVLYQGRAYKMYRGMGSLSAMEKGSKDRYGQSAVEEVSKLVPEGIEGQVPYRGSLSTNLFHLVGGIRSGMGYVGAPTMKELRENAKFIKITAASLKESHPHDVIITKEAPNYRQV